MTSEGAITPDTDQSSQEVSLLGRGKAFAKTIVVNITVEPLILFYGIGLSLQFVINPQLYYEKICKVGGVWFGNGTTFPDDVCDHMDSGDYEEVQTYAQKTYSTINLIVMYVSGIPPILVILFVGPWSDRVGRKYLIVLPLLGYIYSHILFLLNVIFFEQLKVEWLMLEVIQDWLGGMPMIWLGCYSYLSDISSVQARTSRLSILDCTFFCAMAIGAGISGDIFVRLGYEAIYITSIVCHVLALLYTILFLKDSHHHQEHHSNRSEQKDNNSDIMESPSCSTIFTLRNIKDSFKVAVRKRRGGFRHIILLLVLMFFCQSIVTNGDQAINLSYARRNFEWPSTDYFAKWWSTFASVSTTFDIVTLGIIAPILSRILKLSDMVIAMIAVWGHLLCSVTILLARVPGLLYLSRVFRMFSDLTGLAIRVTLTQIVGYQDIGKIFACVGAVQAASGLITPLYNLLYAATLDWHSGLVYCLTCTVLSFQILVITYSYFYIRRNGHAMVDPGRFGPREDKETK